MTVVKYGSEVWLSQKTGEDLLGVFKRNRLHASQIPAFISSIAFSVNFFTFTIGFGPKSFGRSMPSELHRVE